MGTQWQFTTAQGCSQRLIARCDIVLRSFTLKQQRGVTHETPSFITFAVYLDVRLCERAGSVLLRQSTVEVLRSDEL